MHDPDRGIEFRLRNFLSLGDLDELQEIRSETKFGKEAPSCTTHMAISRARWGIPGGSRFSPYTKKSESADPGCHRRSWRTQFESRHRKGRFGRRATWADSKGIFQPDKRRRPASAIFGTAICRGRGGVLTSHTDHRFDGPSGRTKHY